MVDGAVSAWPGAGAAWLGRLLGGMVGLPALFWSWALIELMAQAQAQPSWLARTWGVGVGLALAAAVVGNVASPLVVVLIPLVASYGLVLRNLRLLRPAGARGLLVAATLFFVLALALLVLPSDWLQDSWLLLGMGVDLLLLGYSIAALDAFDEGERLHPDLRRSLLASALAAGIFGGQVAVALAVLGPSVALVGLLITTIASAIASQVLSPRLQVVLDRAAFAGMPALQEARAELRAAETVLPRMGAAVDAVALDEAEFMRLIRRALSHYGDITRLASSPLAMLPIVTERLAERGHANNPLERAAELKALLAESIGRLKPRDKGDFGTADEWRHYNALYFPYVAGLKPYSRRAAQRPADPDARAALEWFQASVPERTLYNWQTAATKLIAQDLRSQCGARSPN